MQNPSKPKRPHAATLSDFIAPKALPPRPAAGPDAFAHQRDILREAINGAHAGFELDFDSCAKCQVYFVSYPAHTAEE